MLQGLLQTGIRSPQRGCRGQRNHGGGVGRDLLCHGLDRSVCLRQDHKARQPAHGSRARPQQHGLLAAGVTCCVNKLFLMSHPELKALFPFRRKGRKIGKSFFFVAADRPSKAHFGICFGVYLQM